MRVEGELPHQHSVQYHAQVIHICSLAGELFDVIFVIHGFCCTHPYHICPPFQVVRQQHFRGRQPGDHLNRGFFPRAHGEACCHVNNFYGVGFGDVDVVEAEEAPNGFSMHALEEVAELDHDVESSCQG